MSEKLLDYLSEGIVIFNDDYKIQFCNYSLLKQLKYSKDELYNEHLQKIISGPIDMIISEKEVLTGQTIDILLSGYQLPPIQVSGKLFRDKWCGQESSWLVIQEDTQTKYNTKELELIIENMPYAVWIADEDDNYKYSNANTLTMVNQLSSTHRFSTTNELLQQHPNNVYKDTLDKNIFKDDQSVLRKNIMINEERIIRNEDGNLQYQLIKIPIFNDQQLYQGYIGISQYSILKQNIDITKVIENSDPDYIVDNQMLYSQLVKSLDFSARAANLFQGNSIIILKFNNITHQVEEICRLQKDGKEFPPIHSLNINGDTLLELLRENVEWSLADFEQRVHCSIQKDLKTLECNYIRINPIEYNSEFMGAIFTTYTSKLQYPLMECCIIDKLCQHIAIIFKSLEYALELRKESFIRKEIEAEKTAYKEALQLETLKTEFLANMSHELKTPLNIMYSMIQMLELELKDIAKNGPIDMDITKIDRYRNIAKQNVFRLLRLIDNITDISKIGAGYYEAKLINCDIVRLIEDITMSVIEYVKNKDLSITFDTEVEELIMACDPEKMERIILNLLSNAVKYTNKGDSIELNLNIIDDRLIILVKDTGIGIPKEKHAMIFERFAQVDSSFSRKQEGSGIGLALVKCLVELQQGTICVESEEGKGSTFIVSLPITQVEEKQIVHETDWIEKEEQLTYKCRIEFSDIYDL